MQNDKNLIEISPKKQDIDEILAWLKEECDINGDGFYHNRNMIDCSYKSGKSIVLKNGEKNIGMVTWRHDNFLVEVDIFVINKKYRGQGYGDFFFNAISEYYKSEGFKAIKLFCKPESSERFWQKKGFQKFPDFDHTEHKLTYYKVLVDTASTSYIRNADKIELWDDEPPRAEGKEPKWKWYIEKQNQELRYPIIQPCNCNWKLRWSKNGKVLREEKVKNFSDVNYESRMLYIGELAE